MSTSGPPRWFIVLAILIVLGTGVALLRACAGMDPRDRTMPDGPAPILRQ